MIYIIAYTIGQTKREMSENSLSGDEYLLENAKLSHLNFKPISTPMI